MDNALIIAASGLRSAERAFARAASGTIRASLPAPPPPPSSAATPMTITQPLDMASGIVAQMQARVSFKANLAAYRTANDLYRALLRATAS